jgi:carbon-monoxide dehydrogenase large subunit
MSLLAHRLDVDPAELRMRNLISEDAYPYASPVGTLYDSGNTAALLTKALQLADREGLRKRQASEKEKLIGMGVCTYVERSGGQDGTTEFAEVEVLRDGKVVVRSGSVSTGQDHRTPLAKIAADELGIEPANVTLLQGDTAFVARGTGTFASRSMQVGGAAVKDACVLLLQEARSRAADHLEVAEADLTYEDGSFKVVGAPEKNVGLAELAADSPLIADHDAVTKQAFPTGAYIAVVEIDRETGEVSLDKLVAVDDCGTIIDPVGTRGQVIGSIAQGVGQSLYEVFVYDDDGQPLTSSMMDYLLPTVSEMVAPTLAHLESPSPFSSVGAKGAGEAGCIGVPPAIANAVEDALGRVVERLDPPFTPEKVWSLLTATRA